MLIKSFDKRDPLKRQIHVLQAVVDQAGEFSRKAEKPGKGINQTDVMIV